ncbi:MAG: hypothetical protein JXA81_02020 [Sedimentisphaerales bacterium]|nr:hypothetical protein [Sedimentisphaerales bacterium]
MVLALQAVADAQAYLEMYGLSCTVNGRWMTFSFTIENPTNYTAWYPGCYVYIDGENIGGSSFLMDHIDAHRSQGITFPTWYIPPWVQVGDHTLEVVVFPGDDSDSVTITVTTPPPPEAPTVVTQSATDIGQTSATLHGSINNDGGETCETRFAYRPEGTGSWSDTGWNSGYSTGQSFDAQINDLTPGTTYEFRAEARNSTGTDSGSTLEFTTEQPDIEFPTVTTLGATDIGQTFATLNGRIDNDGGESCDTQFRIVDIRTGSMSDTGWNSGYSTGQSFDTQISGLTPDTFYDVLAMARNSKGEVEGFIVTFTTLPPDVPTLSVNTLAATDVGSTSATLHGILVGDDGLDCQGWFQYRPVGGTEFVKTEKTGNLRAGDKFSKSIDGLTPNTTYSFMAYAENSVNLDDGGTYLQFTTSPPEIKAPSVLTRGAINVEKTSAELVGRIADDGGEPCQYWFVYRPVDSTQWQETAVNKAGGLNGEYYEQDTANPWQNLLMERLDPSVDFDWGDSSPDPAVPADNFMVRWTGQVEAPATATYTFHTQSDDGVRLWVNNVQLIDNWTDHANAHDSGDIDLTAGQKYDIRLEFYENGGDAVCQLSWSTPRMARAAIPSQYLWSGANQANPTGGTGTNFTKVISDLTPGTTYEFQARAMNSAGTGEGDNQTFTTLPEGFPPVVVTRSATEEEYTSARLSGRIENDGGLACQTRFQYRRQGSEDCQISFEYCLAGSSNWQDIGQEVVLSEDQNFSSTISGLMAGTTYEFRTVAGNSAGTIYGNADSFTTNHAGPGVVEPTVSTLEAAGTGGTSATLNGKIGNDGGEACQTRFEYRVLGSDSWQTTGNGRGYATGQKFSASKHDLASYTTYEFRAVADNSAGTSYGDICQFTTGSEVTEPQVTAPGVSTLPAAVTGGTSATLHGRIDNDGGEECVTRFEYSIAGSGNWEYIGGGGGYSTGQNFSASVWGLIPGTTYEFRAVAGNPAGTSFGSTEQFTPNPAGPQVIAPSVITLPASDIGETSVTLNGRINNEGGFDWQFTPLSNGRSIWVENISTGGNFSAMVTDLIPGTLYEFRAEARNSAGECQGLIQPFITPALPSSPDVITEPANDVKETSATLNGRISDDGGDACEYSFLYRPEGSNNWKDTSWTESALTGDSFSVLADNLIPNTTYEFMALAKNYSGVDEGSILTFITSDGVIVQQGEFVVLHVDDNALNDPGPGNMAISDPDEDGSLIHPFDSIQKAIDVAVNGWKVVVMPGVYTENIDFKAKSIEVSSSEPNGLGIISQTIIDGCSTGPTVSFLNGEDPNSILTGFTITGGLDDLGGGIRCDKSAPTIRRCLIVGNQAMQNGGGIYCNQSQAYFENCTISENYARNNGGGLYCNGSQITLVNSIVWANIPDQIYVIPGQKYQSPIVSYCDIDGNWPGTENLSVDPCFVEPGIWMDVDYPDAGNNLPIYFRGDYHLLSASGRYDASGETWRQDIVTSACIDAGDPVSDWTLETSPNGGRINLGIYGGTLEASRTAIKKPVDAAEIIHGFSLETDPDWIMDGNWQFGAPQGKGGRDDGNPDPVSGYTGNNVYGVNLAGDYSIIVGGPYYLTAGPFDCTGFNNVTLCYSRWLNSDTLPYISNTVEVSTNGTNWTIVWDSMETALTDIEWQTIEHDISQVADGQPAVLIRWGYAVLHSGAYSCSGWNIDDIELKGMP